MFITPIGCSSCYQVKSSHNNLTASAGWRWGCRSFCENGPQRHWVWRHAADLWGLSPDEGCSGYGSRWDGPGELYEVIFVSIFFVSCQFCMIKWKNSVSDYTSSHCCLNTQAFNTWNKTELDSFLIEITANILKFRDSDGTHLLPKIRDSAGQKGTGKWTAISALEYGTPVTLIGKRKKGGCRQGSIWFPALFFLHFSAGCFQ